MPITIENEGYEFDLIVRTVAAGKEVAEFNLFLEVHNVLVIYPVKFPIEVLAAKNRTQNQPSSEITNDAVPPDDTGPPNEATSEKEAEPNDKSVSQDPGNRK